MYVYFGASSDAIFAAWQLLPCNATSAEAPRHLQGPMAVAFPHPSLLISPGNLGNLTWREATACALAMFPSDVELF